LTVPNTFRYTVLPVGQGSGTLIQVLDDAGVPIETSLIDLGSLGWSKDAGKPSADFVIEELQRMAEPCLETLFLSHSDSDHTNLLGRILDAFYPPSDDEPADETLIIKEVWYGGDYGHYRKRSKNILDRIDRYCPEDADTNINTLGVGVSDWHDDPAAPLYETANGVGFWLLYGNAPTTGELYDGIEPTRKGSRAYLRNVSSLVLVVRYGTDDIFDFVASGDATGLTLAGCNTTIDDEDIELAPTTTVSLPHHGSHVTTYDLLGLANDMQDEDDLAEEIVQGFVTRLKPFSITASAGEDHHHRHPASRVIEDFGAHVGDKLYRDAGIAFRKQHFFTSHYTVDALGLLGDATHTTWPRANGWYTGRTTKNVFTIDYFRGNPATLNIPTVFPPEAVIDAPNAPYAPVPPRAAGWAFEVPEDGAADDLELSRVVDRRFASAATMAHLDRVHGGLSPERFVLVPSAPDDDASAARTSPPRRPVDVRAAAPTPRPTGGPSSGLRLRQLP
jgi:hypothetical protein